MNFLNNVRTVHFIGIGGISMSGLAEILLDQGFMVTGSDIQQSPIIEKLRKKGAKIIIPHNAQNVLGADLVVYTSAVKEDNPEMIKARELNLPIIDRASFLGSIMKEYGFGIAVAGCHGKTTSTSMISLILKNAHLDPTILLGGELDAIGGNVRIGKSPYFITEACEYMENFLKFYPYVGVILNIDEDHLDYFKDINHIKTAFLKFARLIPKKGCLVLCSENSHAMEIAPQVNCNVITFGIDIESDYMAKNIKYDELGHPSFDIFKKDKNMGSFSLKVPGRHNIINALSAFAVSDFVGISPEIISSSLLDFRGTHRRFEIVGNHNNITIVDDYAHHPTEIRVTLEAAKKVPHNHIWCIFQPHTYTRTKLLLNEFAHSFYGADTIIITDIYAAREKDTGLIHSKDLTKEINDNSNNALYIKEFEDIAKYISQNAKPGDLVMTIGAGSITNLGPVILEKLKQ